MPRHGGSRRFATSLAISCFLLVGVLLGGIVCAPRLLPLVAVLAGLAAATAARRRCSAKAVWPLSDTLQTVRRRTLYAQHSPPLVSSPQHSPPPSPGEEAMGEQSGLRSARMQGLIERARGALTSLMADDVTFRSHMTSHLDKVVSQLEAPHPGRRPGYIARRCNFLDNLREGHPKRSSRLEVYNAVDALLDEVWPKGLSSTESSRRWRANPHNRDRERTQQRDNWPKRAEAIAERNAEVELPKRPRPAEVRQRGAATPSSSQLEAPPKGVRLGSGSGSGACQRQPPRSDQLRET